MTEANLETGIYRHCGVQPGDTWPDRVERLTAEVDRWSKAYEEVARERDELKEHLRDTLSLNVTLSKAAVDLEAKLRSPWRSLKDDYESAPIGVALLMRGPVDSVAPWNSMWRANGWSYCIFRPSDSGLLRDCTRMAFTEYMELPK